MGNIPFSGDLDYDIITSVGTFIGGIIGSLLTIVTIILIWMTYKTQKQELKETRDMISEQNFQSLFFKMIELLKISYYDTKLDNKKGDEAYYEMNKILFESISEKMTSKKTLALINFRPFIHTLIDILKIINNNFADKNEHGQISTTLLDKEAYFALLQSQLRPEAINFLYQVISTSWISDLDKETIYSSKIIGRI